MLIKMGNEGRHRDERKINLWGVIAGFILIVGLFGPWLWRGYNSYVEFNTRTKKTEIYYHLKIVISPLFILMIRDGKIDNTICFPNFGTSLVGVILISAAVLYIFGFNRKFSRAGANLVNLSILLISFLAFLIFFLSLGRGLGIGISTHVGWGFKMTLIGVILIFFSSLVEYLKSIQQTVY